MDFSESAVGLAGDDVVAGHLVAEAAVQPEGIPLVENHVLRGDHVQGAKVGELAGGCADWSDYCEKKKVIKYKFFVFKTF